ncbi:hypothetical protein DC28_07350 [Spirochaeta lutea]|uniref:Uncharacterized protein n=1 Tax=Spirochaeta lutea TaxID=1480694 RepID=A0A098R0Z1_9SPIO|nr:hypothetical protein DC28_07350 [Spirochaeta lutea]
MVGISASMNLLSLRSLTKIIHPTTVKIGIKSRPTRIPAAKVIIWTTASNEKILGVKNMRIGLNRITAIDKDKTTIRILDNCVSMLLVLIV